MPDTISDWKSFARECFQLLPLHEQQNLSQKFKEIVCEVRLSISSQTSTRIITEAESATNTAAQPSASTPTQSNEYNDLNSHINLSSSKRARKRAKLNREFDYSRFRYRRVALHLCYLGEKYIGLASQVSDYGSGVENGIVSSVEGHLFAALKKAKLIPNGSREDSQYTRCGRTDKGVSASTQIVSLLLRSKASANADKSASSAQFPMPQHEIDYVSALNGLLPEDIRVLGWCDVGEEFSARFMASYRVYRYYFVRRGLNLEAMQKAAQSLVGTHDFRNLCKPDVVNVQNFVRTLYSCHVYPLNASAWPAGTAVQQSRLSVRHEMCYIEIVGQAFLWHQVRCMVAVLFLVGRGLEDPSIIKDLLDIKKVPGRPQYRMANELPLMLYYCHFHHLPFYISPTAQARLVASLEKLWSRNAIRTAMLADMLEFCYERRMPTNLCDSETERISFSGYKQQFNCAPRWQPASSPDEIRNLLVCQQLGLHNEANRDSGVLCAAADPRVPAITLPVESLPGTTSLQRQRNSAQIQLHKVLTKVLCEKYGPERLMHISEAMHAKGTNTLPEDAHRVDVGHLETPNDLPSILPVVEKSYWKYWTYGDIMAASSVAAEMIRSKEAQNSKTAPIIDINSDCSSYLLPLILGSLPDEDVEYDIKLRQLSSYRQLLHRQQAPSIEERLQTIQKSEKRQRRVVE